MPEGTSLYHLSACGSGYVPRKFPLMIGFHPCSVNSSCYVCFLTVFICLFVYLFDHQKCFLSTSPNPFSFAGTFVANTSVTLSGISSVDTYAREGDPCTTARQKVLSTEGTRLDSDWRLTQRNDPRIWGLLPKD